MFTWFMLTMILKIFGTLLLINQALSAKKSTECTAPNGEKSNCILLSDCPLLFEAFTNPRKEDIDYLNKFLCYTGIRSEGSQVCCVTSLNITLDRDVQLTKNLSDTRSCGFQHRDDYFSDDQSISIDEYPWLAAIMARNYREKYNYFWCGGALINERYVLTSALCANDHVGDFIFVRLGEYQVQNDTNNTDCVYLQQFDLYDCTNYEEFYIEEMIKHPFYDYWTENNNIALLKLNRTVTYSDYIRPICLPIPGITLAQPTDTLYTTGLGDTKSIKKKIETKLITQEECIKIIAYTVRVITPNLLCTVDKDDGEKTYYGDQGSPTMYPSKHQWHIEGILLDGTLYIGKASRQVRVSRYLHWIQDNMKVCQIKNSKDTYITRYC